MLHTDLLSWVVQPCFLYNQRSCAQGVVSFIVGWEFHQSSVKKMPRQACLHANMMEEFFFYLCVPRNFFFSLRVAVLLCIQFLNYGTTYFSFSSLIN